MALGRVQCNLSTADRVLRISAGAVAVGAGALIVRGVPGGLLALAGAVLVFSGTVGFCHVYKALGIRTLKPR